MFYREEKLIKAILNDDVAGARKLLRVSGVYSRMECMFWQICLGGSRQINLLHLAAYSNSVEVALLLIDNGEGVNSPNCVGDTPLHIAARYNAWETADLLITCGAKIQMLNHAAQTPQDVALSNGNSSLAELLSLAARQCAVK